MSKSILATLGAIISALVSGFIFDASAAERYITYLVSYTSVYLTINENKEAKW
jgi:hypothetical protein